MANTDGQEAVIRKKYQQLQAFLNERTRRLWAAIEAQVIGYGGVAMVARATGLTRDTADGAGSNGWRNRLWKIELQELAHRTGLTIHVSHFPPGTSQWNKI